MSIIKFSSMIPVPNNMKVATLLKFNENDLKYKDLITAEYRYINANKAKIYQRAKKMYRRVINAKDSFIKTMACNFKLLENKCFEYKKDD